MTPKLQPIILFNHDLPWRVFKRLWEASGGGGSGPVPMHIDKAIWRGMKDRQFYVYFDQAKKYKADPLIIALKLPRGRRGIK